MAIWNTRLSLKVFTWKKCICYYILLWLFSLAYWLLPMLGIWGKIEYMPSTFSCTVKNDYWGDPINIFAIVGLELSIAFLQAYVFTVLLCIYLNDAISLH